MQGVRASPEGTGNGADIESIAHDIEVDKMGVKLKPDNEISAKSLRERNRNIERAKLEKGKNKARNAILKLVLHTPWR